MQSHKLSVYSCSAVQRGNSFFMSRSLAALFKQFTDSSLEGLSCLEFHAVHVNVPHVHICCSSVWTHLELSGFILPVTFPLLVLPSGPLPWKNLQTKAPTNVKKEKVCEIGLDRDAQLQAFWGGFWSFSMAIKRVSRQRYCRRDAIVDAKNASSLYHGESQLHQWGCYCYQV